ncbi:MAG: hypothetical protein ACLR3C_06450 [Eggerthella lenta]
MNVKACYEGYEAEKLYINGGDTHIVASDDAINAAAADLGDDGADAAADASAEAPGSEGGTLPDGMEAPEGAPDGMTPPDGVNGMDGEAPELPEGAETPDATGGTPPSGAPQRNGEGANERELNGGAPDNAFAEGGAGGMGMGDENCLIQINGGYTVLDAQGTAWTATARWRSRAACCWSATHEQRRRSVRLRSDGDGDRRNGAHGGFQRHGAELHQRRAAFRVRRGQRLGRPERGRRRLRRHGGRLVHGGQAVRHGAGHQPRVRRRRHVFAGHRRHRDRANADGYTDSGTVEGGSTTEIAASTTASGGMGGLGAGGGGMPAGQGGDVQRGMRGGAGSGFGSGRRRSQHPFQRRF